MKIPFAIFASGRGSNFEALISASRDTAFPGRPVVLLSDQPNAPVLQKAHALDIPTLVVPKQGSAEDHDRAISKALEPFQPRFLVLAGYMRVLSRALVDAFRSEQGYARIVNIHPSLLPALPGLQSYQKAYEHGCKVTGVTVHLVTEELDGGPICAQQSFSISECAGVEDVERLGLAVEHEIYPKTLKWILKEEFLVERDSKSGRLRVRPH